MAVYKKIFKAPEGVDPEELAVELMVYLLDRTAPSSDQWPTAIHGTEESEWAHRFLIIEEVWLEFRPNGMAAAICDDPSYGSVLSHAVDLLIAKGFRRRASAPKA